MSPFTEISYWTNVLRFYKREKETEMASIIKRIAALTITTLFAVSLYACGTNGSEQTSSNESSDAQTEEFNPEVENIDFSLEGGNLKYDHVEKANAQLTDSANALVFVFNYTNEQDKPASVQSTFSIKFFQNGAELSDNPSYSSGGGEQYKLVGAFFDSALKDGTVTFGRLVLPKDNSPVTIMVSPNDSSSKEYQTMEVTIDSLEQGSKSITPEEVNAALQGKWSLASGGAFEFNNESFICETPQGNLSGSYEVDVEESSIVGKMNASNGTVTINLPFEYENGTLKLFNNKGEEFIKQ